MPKKEEPQYPNDSFATTRWRRTLNISFTKQKLFGEKHFLLLVSPFWSSSPPPRSQNSFEDKKNNRKKEKNFSGTKVQLYIDKGKKLLIYQCYFGETMQVKDFHDQALKESEREEFAIV